MNLSDQARSLAHYLSRIEDRLLNLNPHDVTQRYQLFSIAMNRCTHFENQLGSTGVSLLDVMERNRLSTGGELYSYLYSELPVNIDGKTDLSDVIGDAAKQISEIKDAKAIYQETADGDVHLASDHEIQVGFDRLIKACQVAAAKASIR